MRIEYVCLSYENVLLLTLWGPRCIWGPWDAPTFVLFSVTYKHVNGAGEITLYLAQTGLP